MHGPRRKPESIPVPLQCRQFLREALERPATARFRMKANLVPPDLLLTVFRDLSAQGTRDELSAQANAEDTPPSLGMRSQECLLRSQPCIFFVLIHIHRPAHDHQTVIRRYHRQRISIVKAHRMHGMAAGFSPRKDQPGLLRFKMLQAPDLHIQKQCICRTSLSSHVKSGQKRAFAPTASGYGNRQLCVPTLHPARLWVPTR